MVSYCCSEGESNLPFLLAQVNLTGYDSVALSSYRPIANRDATSRIRLNYRMDTLMGVEPLEVQLARLEEQMKTLFRIMEQEGNGRTNIAKQLQDISTSMATFGHRLGNVEASLANSAPTIEEFITIKHKMVGAGLMGKWVWAFAGGVITFLWSARKEIASWLSGGN